MAKTYHCSEPRTVAWMAPATKQLAPRLRVNAPLESLPEFARAFACQRRRAACAPARAALRDVVVVDL